MPIKIEPILNYIFISEQNTKELGKMAFKMAMVRKPTQMAVSTKGSGLAVCVMVTVSANQYRMVWPPLLTTNSEQLR